MIYILPNEDGSEDWLKENNILYMPFWPIIAMVAPYLPEKIRDDYVFRLVIFGSANAVAYKLMWL